MSRGRWTAADALAHGTETPPLRRAKASTGGATIREPITAMGEREVHESLAAVRRALYTLAVAVLFLAIAVILR